MLGVISDNLSWEASLTLQLWMGCLVLPLSLALSTTEVAQLLLARL